MAGTLSAEDHARVSAAVAAGEAGTAGEIVTIVAESSDGYTDVALAWAAVVAFTALTLLSLFPDFYLGLFDTVTGHWARDWTAQQVLTLAASAAIVKFLSMVVLQMWTPLRLALVPRSVKRARVAARALGFFRIGAESRTTGRTGILIYVSLAEHRAEIMADAAIAAKVAPEAWGEAMHALLAGIRGGSLADGMVAAVGKVGTVLGEHLPRSADDVNELPDRLIEV